jgi:anti-sigma factor ChrR (cupin superfamily)
MRRAVCLVVLFMVVAAVPLLAAEKAKVAAPATPAPPAHVAMAPSAMQWGDAPPSLPKGARLAVLQGDPSKPEMFIIRLKAGSGYRVAPHWHPTRENVTVISGKFHIAMGDTFDTSKGDALPAGGFASMDAKMHHYAWTEGETEVEVSGMGPFVINYLNPKDDPSKAAKK